LSIVGGAFQQGLDKPLLVRTWSKGCKTLQLTDLAVSLATGTPWMRSRVRVLAGVLTDQRRENAAFYWQTFRGLGFRGIDFAELDAAK
jgi:hypothetical protein